MALFVPGATICPICGQQIQSNEQARMFPPLTANALDPLMFFSDVAFHEECFRRHSLAARAEARLKEIREKNGSRSPSV